MHPARHLTPHPLVPPGSGPPAASPAPEPVLLSRGHAAGTRPLVDLARAAYDVADAGVAAMVRLALEVEDDVPLPGSGETLRRWEVLATVAAQDLTAARALEPHLDAVAVLAEAGPAAAGVDDLLEEDEGRPSWGVWAAEGPGARLRAVPDPATGGVRLTGRKPWCSLAREVSHALVTAWVDEERRGLFAVRLADPGVLVEDGPWSSLGLAEAVTSTVVLDGVPAREVGGPGWYLERPGFAWGGIGVAAVWYGGAVAVARRLHEQCGRRDPDQVALVHLGAVDAALAAARAVLVEAATDVDTGCAAGASGALAALRARQVVADTVEEVTGRVARALGPGPLAHEHRHARRVADLGLYVRQHHGERDQAALGRELLARGSSVPGVSAW